MSPMAVCDSVDIVARAILLLLLLYPLLAWRWTRTFRRAGGELTRAAIPFAFAPLFLALAVMWRQFEIVLLKRELTGGGVASTAAGTAEAFVTLVVGSAVAAFVTLLFLQQARRGGWHCRSGAFEIAAAVVLLVLLVHALRIPPLPSMTRNTALALAGIALLFAVASFVVAICRVRVTVERIDGPPAYVAAGALMVACVAVLTLAWHAIGHLRAIAMGVAR